MKTNRILYWIATILFSLVTLLGSINFIFNSTVVHDTIFSPMGFPAELVIPLGIAKGLGILAILVNISTPLKRLAYFGLLTELIVAMMAHLVTGFGDWYPPLIPFTLGALSYVYWLRISK